MKRDCGNCTDCCYTCTVLELDKDANQRCPHQAKTGCAIYADRPNDCRSYSCAWREGLIPKKGYRPDEFAAVEAYQVNFYRGPLEGRRIQVLMVYPGRRRLDFKKAKALVNANRCVLVAVDGEITMLAASLEQREAGDVVLAANDEAFRSSGKDTRTAVSRDGSYSICQIAGSNPATMDDVRNDFPQFFPV